MNNIEIGSIWRDIQYPYIFKITRITKEPFPHTSEQDGKLVDVVWGVDINTGKEIGDYASKFGFFYQPYDNTKKEITLDEQIKLEKAAYLEKSYE